VVEPKLIGPWSLDRVLGAGGNAEVWLAHDEKREVALKILKTRRADSEQYARFRNEIDVLRQLEDEPGILPIIDASLPLQPSRSDPAWIAMPRAILIREALSEASLADAVTAVRDIAATLARVAARGIAHRDLKPENLYSFENAWVVSDFGLAHVPDASERGLTKQRLGAFGYMPDELFNNAAEADAHGVDVFQLAKCLLVLAAGLPDPPQGTIEAGSSGSLSRYVVDSRVDALDRLIERCTRRLPAERPSMADVARELGVWLDYTPVATPDIADLAAQFRRTHRASLDGRAQADRWKLRLEELSRALGPTIEWVTETLRAAELAPEISFYHARQGWVERVRSMGMQPQLAAVTRWVTAEFGSVVWPTKIVLGVGLDLDAQGEFWCAGHLAWGDLESSATRHVGIGERTANIESMEADAILDALSEDVQAACREMFEELARTS
jgi:hypothetical protein